MISEYDCEYCGAKKPQKKAKSKVVIARELKKLPPPKAEHIIKYCIANELDVNDAKNLTANYVVDMLIFAKTPKETVYKDERFTRLRIDNLIRPIYFDLHASKIDGNRRRTLVDFRNKVFKKIDKYYEK